MEKNRAAILSALCLALPTFLIYLFTTNQNFSFDAVTNAIACEAGEPARWFHGNHLLYPFLGVMWFKLEQFFGYSGLSIYSLAHCNSFFMATGLGILWITLKREVGNSLALMLALFLGTTYAVWHYAVDGRAIGISVFSAILVIAQLLRIKKSSRVTTKDALVLAGLSALHVFAHGIALLQAFPLFIWIYMAKKSPGAAKTYALALGGILLCAYVAVYEIFAGPASCATFTGWALGYAGFQGAGSAMDSAFWASKLSEIIRGLFNGWNNALMFSAPTTWGPVISRIFGVLVLAGLLTAFATGAKRANAERNFIFLLIGWGAIIMIFLAFWSPGQEGFRLHVIIPWFVAAILSVPRSKPLAWGLGMGAAVLFYVNFTYAMYPASFIQNNPGFMTMNIIKSHLRPGDLVLAAQPGTIPGIEVLKPYLFPEIQGGTIEGRLLAFRERDLDKLLLSLDTKSKYQVGLYFAEDIFDPTVQSELEKRQALRYGELLEFANCFERKEFFELPNGRKVYRVLLKSLPPAVRRRFVLV